MILTVETKKTQRKPYPIGNLSTTNTTYTDPGANPGLRCGRPVTNRLSHGTANSQVNIRSNYHWVMLKQPSLVLFIMRNANLLTMCFSLMLLYATSFFRIVSPGF
jgi:hypothetical protein